MGPEKKARIVFPPGTRLALIDLDGTLLQGMNAERIFYLHLLVHGHVSIFGMIGFLFSLLRDIVRMGFRPSAPTPASSRAAHPKRSANGPTPSGRSSCARPSPRSCGPRS
jgi:hypothetical protein